jgi:hypothetical protein
METRRRPPAGTTLRSEADENMVKVQALHVVRAAQLMAKDADVAALSRAKADGDDREVGRLLRVVGDRYGRGSKLLSLFRAL